MDIFTSSSCTLVGDTFRKDGLAATKGVPWCRLRRLYFNAASSKTSAPLAGEWTDGLTITDSRLKRRVNIWGHWCPEPSQCTAGFLVRDNTVHHQSGCCREAPKKRTSNDSKLDSKPELLLSSVRPLS